MNEDIYMFVILCWIVRVCDDRVGEGAVPILCML